MGAVLLILQVQECTSIELEDHLGTSMLLCNISIGALQHIDCSDITLCN